MRQQLYRVIKRFFDISSSMLAILFFFLLGVLIAAGIKCSSKGPVFYKAERIGKNAEKFTLYKFRSMHVYQPERKSEGEQREGGYIANENRIFPFGGFLRKSKLDELPQLINILMGQMSVIGPRPITEAGVKKHYIGRYDDVLTVRPGLACLDSLFDYAHGELVIKDNEEYERKVVPIRDYLASLYVEKQSLALDIYCILRTISLIFQVVVLKKRDFMLTKYEKMAHRAVVRAEQKE